MAQLKDLIVNGPARIIGDLQGSNISASNIIATTFNGYLSGTAGNAVTAQYATFDEDGNEIATQYVHSISVTSNASTMTITLSNTKNSQISSITLPINTTTTAGIIPINSTTGLKVWGTDYSGNPGWRESIPFIIGTGTTAGTWLGTLDNLTEYYDGLLILYKSPVAGASTTTLKLNNLEAKTVYINNATKLTTHFPVDQPILLVYSASQNSGCWMALDDYWTNSDTKLRTYRFDIDDQNATQNVDLPLAALSGTSTTSITNPSFNFTNTSNYLDVYGVRSSDSSIQALYNPYSGLVTVQDLTVRNNISTTSIIVNSITAINLTADNKIDGVALKDDIIHYGTCTSSNSYIKAVSCSNFTLVTGSKITVNFTTDNTYSGTSAIQLQVNNTTAKNIFYNGTNIPVNLLKAGSIYDFVYDGTQYQLIGGAGKGVEVNVFENNATATDAYYITGQSGSIKNDENLYKAAHTTSANTAGIYFTPADCVLMGAAWNDYAEFRQPKEKNIEPGKVVKENGDGTMSLTTQRLERGCEIVSDTYGFSIGKNNKATLPIAVSGRVLAYPDKNPLLFTIGAPVCSGPNGTVSEMTEEEEMKYPSRIIGTVSEIPNYKIWHGANDIEVNGRIWIRIR